MQGFGALLIIWGILDYIMGESGTDVYYDWFGIYLPDSIYNYSHWISMAIGTFLVGAGRATASSNSSSSSTPKAATGSSGSSNTNSALAGGAAGAVTGMSAAQMAALKRAQESAQQYTEEQKAEEEEPEFDAGDMDI
jgi:hypothetical protein